MVLVFFLTFAVYGQTIIEPLSTDVAKFLFVLYII